MKNLLLVALIFTMHLSAIEKRTVALNHKLSIIVPCHWVHAKYLPELMEALQKQTYLPDEVVIALSKTAEMTIEDLNETRALCLMQPFPVKLLEFPERRYTGHNRTTCARAASHPILVHNDADDLPLPKRLERIKWAFDHYDIEALVHSFTRDGDATYEEKGIEPFVRKELFQHKLHLGSVSFVVDLLKSVPWRDTCPSKEDKFYIREASRKGHTIAILEENLIYYRNHLSTWGENNDGQM